MDVTEFKEFAQNMVEYVAQYLETIKERPVLPSVEPGYLRPLIPDSAPENPERWQNVMEDIERVIMPGITQWQSPRFHAYFPSANSYPAIVADMLSDAIACIGFSWIAAPACTELEMVMLDWLGKMLDLPEEFLACSGGPGGGVILGNASQATLVALLGAKAKIIQKLKKEYPEIDENAIVSKLVAYSSDQAHCSVERAGLLGGVRLRLLPTDDEYKLRGSTLQDAIQEDRDKGFMPFYVVATLGTTSICSFDNLDEIGVVCQKENVWLHIDAAYAGAAFICPEYRYLMRGIERADSFDFNPHKWMLVTFDCSTMWLRNPEYIVNNYNVDPLYLKHIREQKPAVPDYRHWQIPFGRGFRSLKLWFVMRIYGVKNLQAYIRNHIAHAHEFANFLRSDSRFEIVGDVILGLVCFRLKGSNEMNEELLEKINTRGKIFLVAAKIKDLFFLRFAICSRYTQSADIQFSWDEIKYVAGQVLALPKI
ncbi:hypothetical protein V9T40_012446 [Parthenolecanium corni]|uniref:Aromatic-L-amino-acid decarboxylase n=1 Tax=Parthenolecanium corni TaxID=536013 RepID=A0AAN9T9J4_9HEMI